MVLGLDRRWWRSGSRCLECVVWALKAEGIWMIWGKPEMTGGGKRGLGMRMVVPPPSHFSRVGVCGNQSSETLLLIGFAKPTPPNFEVLGGNITRGSKK